MVDFFYQKQFPLVPDNTTYRMLDCDAVQTVTLEGQTYLKVDRDGLRLLSREAFTDIAFLLRTSHLEQLARIFEDAEASPNDRYVALELLKNAVISADRVFPMCQDTGTAIIIGKKGHQVLTDGHDEEALSQGVYEAYTQNYLRYSQNAPLDMFTEKNTGCNLPAQLDLYATRGADYTFLFLAKGGGSANKTYLYQETRAVLNRPRLLAFIKEKMASLGTTACPPYHLALVIGGLSAEMTLKTVKLASAGYLDGLPTAGNEHGQAFRDLELEAEAWQLSRQIGLGAQFGGPCFCHDVRVVRLPRHGASCPIGIGVSCSADRNIKARISAAGIALEQLETDPARFLPQPEPSAGEAVFIDLNQPMEAIRARLSACPIATRLLLTGPIIVARDIAHAKLQERLDAGEDLPEYFKQHIIYYAGPAKTPSGYPSGSFGPTTAGRMDSYVPTFQARGGSLVMLAKGNRTRIVTDACQKYGGFYLGSIGGPAARLGRDCITGMELLEYPELGMEAIYRITVKDFPAFVIVNDKGQDFFESILR